MWPKKLPEYILRKICIMHIKNKNINAYKHVGSKWSPLVRVVRTSLFLKSKSKCILKRTCFYSLYSFFVGKFDEKGEVQKFLSVLAGINQPLHEPIKIYLSLYREFNTKNLVHCIDYKTLLSCLIPHQKSPLRPNLHFSKPRNILRF